LNPLKAKELIILADPQWMIRAGARAVEGWAKESGFTVLLGSAGAHRVYCQFSTQTTGAA